MSREQNRLEEQIDASTTLREARNFLDDFHESLEVLEDEEMYQEAKEMEVEFEKALFYSISATGAMQVEIKKKIDKLANSSGRPEDIYSEVRNMEEDYRQYSIEMLEKARGKFDGMFHSYRSLAGPEHVDMLSAAAKKYNEVFQHARNEIEKEYDLDMMIQKEVSRRRV